VPDYLPPVVAKLQGDDASLTRVLATAKDKVKRWAVDVGKTKVTLTVDAKLRDGAAERIQQRIGRISGTATVGLRIDEAQQRRISAQLQRGPMTVPVKPVMDQQALRRVQVVLRELGRRIDVPVRPQMDDGAQRRAEARLARISRDRTVTIRTRVVGGGTPGNAAAGAANGVGAMATLISLAPALTPIAAVATNVALSLTAGTVAVGAFGLAVKSQLTSLGAAADAQGKYDAAVAKYGPLSKQAVQANQAVSTALDGMPVATQRAAMGFLHLKDDFKGWSDGLARFTMQPVLHSFAVAEQILPRLSPMVKDTSGQLDRLVTVAGGAVNTPGFDRIMKEFTAFADGALKHSVDDLIHFTRVLSEGGGNGAVGQFLAYAKAEGPQVKQTMADIARAVETLLKASSEAGPGMLTLVDDVAKLVAALPPSFVARVMQAYAAFRLFKLANSGITAVTDSVRTLSTRLAGLRAASAGAGGGVRGVGAAVGSLSTGAKVAGAVGIIAGLAYAAYKLTDSNKQARISVDDLSRSIQTGLSKGRIASPVLDELRQGMAGVLKETDASAGAWDKIGYSFTHWGAKWSSSASSSKAVANAQRDLGKAIGEVAQNQGVDKATQALALLNKEGAKVPTKYLKDYNNALADQAFQDQMAANAMGMFGNQAQAVQKKLDAQKQAAQGLQQAILDLNDANRAAMDAESQYRQSIDDATAMIKGHTKALSYSNGELDLGNQKAREAYGALSQMAASAESVSTAVLTQTGSQDKANRVLIDAHDRLVATAEKMGLNSQKAHQLADSLDSIKDPKVQVTVQTMTAESNLARAKAKVNAFPKSTRTTANFAYQQALADLRFYQQMIDRLHGKTVTVTINGVKTGVNASTYFQAGPHKAGGGLITGPGTGTSDSVPMMGSNGEFVVNAQATRQHRAELEAINSGSTGVVARAASVTAVGGNVASGLAAGIRGGQADVVASAVAMAHAAIGAFSSEMGIASPSKKFRALGAYTISGLVQGLTGSTASVKAATKKIASMLYSDFGSSHKGLQQTVARDNAQLLKLASQRDSVASKLKTAQTNLANIGKQWSSEKSTIASGIMQGASIITTGAPDGRPVNTNDVISQMQDKVKQATQFAAELEQLRKKGLRSDLIQQLATAGVDQAGATALALAGGSSSQIQQMNKLQSGLSTAANATGTAVANSMYGAGIQSARGLIKGLQSQEKAIDAQMLRIAKSMQAAIKKALGIKSPSRVMAELGDYTAQGMAVGINRSTKHAVIAARGMAMAVRQGATITGSTGGGYRGGDVHVHVTVQGSVTSERNLVETVRTGLLKGGLRNSNVGLTPKR
jgi:hypothetical protein